MKENKTRRTFFAVLTAICVAMTFSACAELLGTSTGNTQAKKSQTTSTSTSTSASSTSAQSSTSTSTTVGQAKADGSTSKGRKAVTK